MVTGYELNLNQYRNSAINDLQDAAHARAVRRRADFVQSNPGAVSPWERDSTLGRRRKLEDRDAYREQEIAMLKQQGENAVMAERERAAGMRAQGAEAAGINAEAAKYAADAQKEAALKKAELDAANGKAQWGMFDNAGNYVPGGQVKAAELQANATLENARLEREARITAAEHTAQNRLDVANVNADAKKDVAGTTAQATVTAANLRAADAEQRQFEAWQATLSDLNKSAGIPADELAKLRAMTPEQQKQYWREKTGRAK